MKNVITFITIACMGFSANAQDAQLGFRVGPNLNEMRGNDYVDEYHQSMIGFTAGAFLRMPITKKTFLLTALQYERNGSTVRNLIFADQFGNNPRKGDLFNYLNYLVLPIMAEYRSGTKVKYSLQAGPFVGYLLSQHSKIKWDEENADQPDNNPLGGWDLKNFNCGLSAGAGITIPFNKKIGLDLHLEDHFGLFNISNGYIFGGALKTHALNFTVGIVCDVK